MELAIFWTAFSQEELKKIYDYYKEVAGAKVAKKIVTEIYKETLKLKSQPKVGQIEPLLKNRKEKFRYLVIKNYKVIYHFNKKEKFVEINDVFDTRQNPVKLQRSK